MLDHIRNLSNVNNLLDILCINLFIGRIKFGQCICKYIVAVNKIPNKFSH